MFTKHQHHLQIDFTKSLGKPSGSPNVFEGKICGRKESFAVKQIPLDSEKATVDFQNECKIMVEIEKKENFVKIFDNRGGGVDEET